jgi:hypothetical protein
VGTKFHRTLCRLLARPFANPLLSTSSAARHISRKTRPRRSSARNEAKMRTSVSDWVTGEPAPDYDRLQCTVRSAHAETEIGVPS